MGKRTDGRHFVWAPPTDPMTVTSDLYCPLCDERIWTGDRLADHDVWKFGEIAYTELAHYDCGLQYNEANEVDYWVVG